MNLDMRRYGRLSMFVHAESVVGSQPVNDNQLSAVIRIGSDFLNNYYEIKIPLRVTRPGSYASTDADERKVWPDSNSLDFNLQDLVQLKVRRNNNSQYNINNYYQETIGYKSYAIKGNPNLGEVQAFLIGVENSTRSDGILLMPRFG